MFLLLGLAVCLALAVWLYRYQTASNDTLQKRYQTAQDSILGARLEIKRSQDSLRAMRDTITVIQVQRDNYARSAAAALRKVDDLQKVLPPPPMVSDSTNPIWEHRAIALQDINDGLRKVITLKDSVLLADSAEMDVYTRRIRKDSVTLAYAEGALEAAHSVITVAQKRGKLFGLIPLPTRIQSYVAGGLTVVAIGSIAKHHGN